MGILSAVLLVVAVIIGVVRVRANTRAKRGNGPARLRRGAEPTLEDVGPGGVFSLRAVGVDMEDLDITIEARHVYSQGSYEWLELEGDAGGRTVWVTVEHDDMLEVSITLRKLRLDDLGLTRQQLDEFDDAERGRFEFEGREFLYDDSDDAMFHRNGDPDAGEAFHYWEFESRDESHSITVERWRDGSFECHVSQPLRESQITIYSVSGEG